MIGNLYLVLKPTDDSTLEDIVILGDAASLENQFTKQGLKAERIYGFFDDYTIASSQASVLLRQRDESRNTAKYVLTKLVESTKRGIVLWEEELKITTNGYKETASDWKDHYVAEAKLECCQEFLKFISKMLAELPA